MFGLLGHTIVVDHLTLTGHVIIKYVVRKSPTEICCHLSENLLKGRFFGQDKLQNHTNEGKEKEKERKKEGARRRKGGKQKKSNGCTLSFFNGYFGDSFGRLKSLWTGKVHLGVTFSKIRREIYFPFYYYCHFP